MPRPKPKLLPSYSPSLGGGARLCPWGHMPPLNFFWTKILSVESLQLEPKTYYIPPLKFCIMDHWATTPRLIVFALTDIKSCLHPCPCGGICLVGKVRHIYFIFYSKTFIFENSNYILKFHLILLIFC